MAMQLQGQNLSILRKQMKDQKLTLGTTALIGIHMINAIESMHELGFLHRDIKPANFVLSLQRDGYDGRKKCFIIDFGLSRQFINEKGMVRPPRSRVGFRGTARYASLHSHRCEELSRRDDIWSLFYILVEFATGKLPWSREKEKEVIALQKEQWMDYSLISELPPNFKLFFDHVRKLDYLDCPDYAFLRSLLFDMFERLGESHDVAYDWERPGCRVRNSISVMNSAVNSRIEHPDEEKPCHSNDSKATLTDSGLKLDHDLLSPRRSCKMNQNRKIETFSKISWLQDPLRDINVPNGGSITQSSRTLTASIELRQFRIEGLSGYGTDHEIQTEPTGQYPGNPPNLVNSQSDNRLSHVQFLHFANDSSDTNSAMVLTMVHDQETPRDIPC
jgi:serine/threonine protein kinase